MANKELSFETLNIYVKDRKESMKIYEAVGFFESHSPLEKTGVT